MKEQSTDKDAKEGSALQIAGPSGEITAGVYQLWFYMIYQDSQIQCECGSVEHHIAVLRIDLVLYGITILTLNMVNIYQIFWGFYFYHILLVWQVKI